MSDLLQLPLYGIALTIIVYMLSLKLRQRVSWFHPLFVTSVVLITLVGISDTYNAYQPGGEWITFLLGPATIALGVPMYKQMKLIQKQIKAIAAGVIVGSAVSLFSVWLFFIIFEGSDLLLRSMLPKSVTAPVAVEIVRQLNGYPELGVVFTVVTGLLGSMFGPLLLKKIGIQREAAIGTAIGTAAHGIGTARLVRDSELQGSISGLAMGLSVLCTSLLVIPLYVYFQ